MQLAVYPDQRKIFAQRPLEERAVIFLLGFNEAFLTRNQSLLQRTRGHGSGGTLRHSVKRAPDEQQQSAKQPARFHAFPHFSKSAGRIHFTPVSSVLNLRGEPKPARP